MEFQAFMHVPQTGVIDAATQDKMRQKRCGMPDIERSKRHRRFIIQGSGWENRNVTWG